ncbi:hypothetical protein D3C87_1197540 [compost metagenome]
MHHQSALVEHAEQIDRRAAALDRTAVQTADRRPGAQVDDVARSPEVHRPRVDVELRQAVVGDEAEVQIADVAIRRIEERRVLTPLSQRARRRIRLEGQQAADRGRISLDRLGHVHRRALSVAPVGRPDRTERIGQKVQGVGHARQGDRATGGVGAARVRVARTAAQDRGPGQVLDEAQRRRRQLQRRNAAVAVVVAAIRAPANAAFGRRHPQDGRVPVATVAHPRIARGGRDRGHVAARAEQADAGVVTPQREAGLHHQAVRPQELTGGVDIADRHTRHRGLGRARIADAGQDQIAARVDAHVGVADHQGDAPARQVEGGPQRIGQTRIKHIYR